MGGMQVSVNSSKLPAGQMGAAIEIIDGYTLPEKDCQLHKGSNGTLFIVGGCRQYQGAITLSVCAALRAGCGIVMAFVPESIYLPVACKTESAVIFSCPENDPGTLSYDAIKKIEAAALNRKPGALLVGTGMGVNGEVGEIVEYALHSDIPCIVDGDGLRYVRDEWLQNRKKATILTPHMGEFCRMINCELSVLQRDRFIICKEYAVQNHVTLILKDAMTVITFPNGDQRILNKANAGLAKGGSGDVLAGMVASFAAQGMEAEQAATAAVWFHSLAGKITAEEMGTYAMLPGDVIQNLYKAFLY